MSGPKKAISQPANPEQSAAGRAVEIRWEQRLSSFAAALSQLTSGVELANQRPLSSLEKQGLIQAFEFTHELAWNVLRDYLQYQGNSQISGSRDATREGFQMGLLANGTPWMEMIQSRNQTSHTYNQSTADDIVRRVIESYHIEFLNLKTKMEGFKGR